MTKRTYLCILIIFSLMLSMAAAEDPGQVTPELLNKFKQSSKSISDYDLKFNAVTNNSVNNLVLNRDVLVKYDDMFNLSLKPTGITNQKSSGRCWLFAGSNVFSPEIKKTLDLSDFEFSHAFLTFYDRLEKANMFLEEVIKYRDKPLDDRRVSLILESPFGDGGWWDYFANLIEKYGIVPEQVMPETKQSVSTGMINSLTQRKLRQFASELRTMHKDSKNIKEIRRRKEAMLEDIYKFLVINYGQPPDEFTFKYETKIDKDTLSEIEKAADSGMGDKEKIIVENSYTPITFRNEFIAEKLPDYVPLCNVPYRKYDKLYQAESSRNMWENKDFTMLNLPMNKIKEYCLKTLEDSQLVWFACDVGADHYSDSGLLALNIYDYKSLYGMDFKLTKAERLQYFDSYANHAMVLAGVDTTDAGIPTKWRIKNSWGADRGDKGFWTMYDDWFDEYVYVVVINKKYLDPDDIKKLEQKPEIIPMWDPLSLSLKRIQF